ETAHDDRIESAHGKREIFCGACHRTDLAADGFLPDESGATTEVCPAVERRLEARDAREMRGHADAAADVGADSERRQTRGDRARLSPGRASRSMREAPRIRALAEQRAVALVVEEQLRDV